MIEDVILASASPARAQLLAAAGVEFRTVPAEIDEDEVKRNSAPKTAVRWIARWRSPKGKRAGLRRTGSANS